MHGRVQSPHCRALTRSGHSPLGPPQTVLPGQFPLLFYMCGKLPLFIKLSTVNVYKNYIGRSVRVRITVSATFQIFALTAGGDVLGGGNCPGGTRLGKCSGVMPYTRPHTAVRPQMLVAPVQRGIRSPPPLKFL